MASQKLEYDSSMGGSVVLGNYVPTYRYAASAVNEIRELLEEVRHPTSRKLIFQTLPKHMRRRAMSHHPKRLPRKYRSAHRAQMAKAGKPQPTKRPSRKHRRRPGNLLREYLRRQRRHVWLETHIWHARRFHMVNRWGYRLPYASCDKTYRACYRASAQHCLLQDISFHACLQMKGSLEDLRTGFARLSSPKCGLSITAKTFVSGRREGAIELFRDGQYPEGALGCVSFIWRPLDKESVGVAGISRTLWLWVHPSAYHSILEEIIKVFHLISMKSVKVKIQSDGEEEILEKQKGEDKDNGRSSSKLPTKQKRRLQFMTKTLAYERIKRYSNAENNLRLCELKDTMNRFRLTGPLSQTVLSHAFKVKELKSPNDTRKDWLSSLMAKEVNFENYHTIQGQYWQQCAHLTTPAELLSNMVIALNIEDPRLNRPQKRTKALPTTPATTTVPDHINDILVDTPNCLPQSAIWDADLRHHICEEMLTTPAYCKERAKNAVVPGERCKFEDDMQPVPVLLIQRPGSQQPQYKRLGYGCGWDVITPAGYGMPVWMSLIMWGAKAGGLREFDSVARELGTEQYLPDTVAGLQTSLERYTELKAKYFRKPPNKRSSYSKLAIVSPFRCPFPELVRDWWPESGMPELEAGKRTPFHVLRDRHLLEELNVYLQQKCHTFPPGIPPNCLIQLQLRLKSRGNLDDNSLICLPTQTDLKRNFKQMKRENHDPVYTEPLLTDQHKKERKILRVEHKKLLKRLRARRVREKRKKQETSTTRVHIRPAGTSHLVTEQFKKMCSLWLPEDFSTLFSIRKQCTRDVFGYITKACFCYTEATVSGIGYVTPRGLQELLNLCHRLRLKQPMCLVRNTHSRHYRFATFKLNPRI